MIGVEVRVLLLQEAFIPLAYCHSEFKCLSGNGKLNGISKHFSILHLF